MKGAEIHYGWFERFAMRLLFAIVIAWHIPASLARLRISAPHGIVRLLDLSFLLDPSVLLVCRYLLWAALILYVCRVAWWFALPYMTLLSVFVGSLTNSQGAINHSTQIVSLVLGLQTAAYVVHCIQRWRGRESARDPIAEDRIVFWSQQAIVATYLVAGLTKIIQTGGMWFFRSHMIGAEIIKSTDQDYYSRLDAAAHQSGTAVAEWIAQHPLIVGLALGSGLLLELASPLALRGRHFALCFGLALLAFHESIDRVMRLQFHNNEYLLWIYFVNAPFWILLAAGIMRARLGGGKQT